MSAWDDLQEQQFLDWVNFNLDKRDIRVDDLAKDFQSGVNLVHLVEILTEKKVGRFTRNPRMISQKLDNINISIAHVEKFLGNKMIGVNVQDVAVGSSKQTMGLLFYLVQKFGSCGVSNLGPAASQPVRRPKPKPHVELSESIAKRMPDSPIPSRFAGQRVKQARAELMASQKNDHPVIRKRADTPLKVPRPSVRTLRDSYQHPTPASLPGLPPELPRLPSQIGTQATPTDSTVPAWKLRLQQRLKKTGSEQEVLKECVPATINEKPKGELVKSESSKPVSEVSGGASESSAFRRDEDNERENQRQSSSKDESSIMTTGRKEVLDGDMSVPVEKKSHVSVLRVSVEKTTLPKSMEEVSYEIKKLQTTPVPSKDEELQSIGRLSSDDSSAVVRTETKVSLRVSAEKTILPETMEEVSSAIKKLQSGSDPSRNEAMQPLVDQSNAESSSVAEKNVVDVKCVSDKTGTVDQKVEVVKRIGPDISSDAMQDSSSSVKVADVEETHVMNDQAEAGSGRRVDATESPFTCSQRKESEEIIFNPIRKSSFPTPKTESPKSGRRTRRRSSTSPTTRRKSGEDCEGKVHKNKDKPRLTRHRGRSVLKVTMKGVRFVTYEDKVVKAQAVVRGFLARIRCRLLAEKKKLSELVNFFRRTVAALVALTRLQAVARGRRERKRLEKEDVRVKMLWRRNKIAQEILDSERSYMKSLRLLEEVYVKPLQDILTRDQHRTVFSNLEVILNYNGMLLSQLEERYSRWFRSGQRLGDIFKIVVGFMKVYSLYCNNYTTAIMTVQDCMKSNSKFSKLVQRAKMRHDCGMLDISSFLIMPVQRLPRYVMLLQDLHKHTPENHPDFKDIGGALEQMKDVAQYVNEQRRAAENLNQVYDIQVKLQGSPNLVVAHRRFVRQGVLMEVNEKPFVKGPWKSHCLFLFTDVILFSKARDFSVTLRWKKGDKRQTALEEVFSDGAMYRYEFMFEFKSDKGIMGVFDVPDNPSMKIANAFLLKMPEGGRSVTFHCTNEEEKTSWMADVDDCMATMLYNDNSRCEHLQTSSPKPLEIPTAPEDFKGVLMMQSGSNQQLWKERLFVLREDFLYCYACDDPNCADPQVSPKHCWHLTRLSPQVARVTDRPNCLLLKIKDARKHTLQAQNSFQLFSLLHQLHARLHLYLTNLQLQALQDDSRENVIDRSSSPAPTGNLSGAALVKQLLAMPGNDSCADCSSKDICWASTCLGVFVCGACADAHRCLPKDMVNLVSLRSLHKCEPSVLQKLEQLGNANVNKACEERVPSFRRPSPHESSVVREAWIKSKYVPAPAVKPAVQQPSLLQADENGVYKKGVVKRFEGERWRKYFFVLRSNSLQYSKGKQPRERHKRIDLKLCTARPPAKACRPHSFELVTPTRIFVVAARSETEMQSWLAAIMKVKFQL